jgi:hypothetical protein
MQHAGTVFGVALGARVDWLIDYLLFDVPLKNVSLIWRRYHYRWMFARFRPMLGAQGLWAKRDLYRATPTLTRELGFSGLIRRTAPFSRLLRRAWGCGGPILTQILKGHEHESARGCAFKEFLYLIKADCTAHYNRHCQVVRDFRTLSTCANNVHTGIRWTPEHFSLSLNF